MDRRGTRDYHRAVGLRGTKKISYDTDQRVDLLEMRVNVLASDVRAEFLVAIWITVENEANFLPLPPRSIFLRAEKNPKLQRHVESGQTIARIQLNAREVMNADSALRNNLENFADPYLARIIDLQRATSEETAILHRENDGVQKPQVLPIKWAVDENAEIVFSGNCDGHAPWSKDFPGECQKVAICRHLRAG